MEAKTKKACILGGTLNPNYLMAYLWRDNWHSWKHVWLSSQDRLPIYGHIMIGKQKATVNLWVVWLLSEAFTQLHWPLAGICMFRGYTVCQRHDAPSRTSQWTPDKSTSCWQCHQSTTGQRLIWPSRSHSLQPRQLLWGVLQTNKAEPKEKHQRYCYLPL